MKKKAVKIAPSILAANLADLGEQVTEVERCEADRINVDGMDGHFVPNISFGAAVVTASYAPAVGGVFYDNKSQCVFR